MTPSSFRSVAVVLPFVASLTCGTASTTAAEPVANRWELATRDVVGPRVSPALIWSPERKRFVLIGGIVSHAHREPRTYDVLSFDPDDPKWINELPAGAEKRGGEVGVVTDPGFASPYFELADRDGIVRPHPHHSRLDSQYAFASWNGKTYAIVCGRTLRYDPVAREWRDMQPESGPAPASRSYKGSLNWGALCADPVNRELVLFGGCGLATQHGTPGTWAYSTESNRWRKLELATEPSPRAHAPMVFDPASRKIVLFGGDGLDELRADTWLYDPTSRTWEERHPKFGPSPRFGHALLHLPRSGKIVLIGGNGYTSSTAYQAKLYRTLPFETWTYDVAANRWGLASRIDEGAPPSSAVRCVVAAVDDADRVLLVATGDGTSSPPSTWLATLDATRIDEEGTQRHGVPTGTVERRTGSYDPDWYAADVPPADPAATAAVLANLPANRWVALECPKWPENRMGGGWSTVAFDVDRDQILHLGGGHSSYFGNDVAHYDVRTGRWSVSYRPQFALDYNYDLSGPGPWAFNDGPWGNHNYRSYAYDPTCRRLVVMRDVTQLYDPVARSWSPAEKIETPFPISKYTTSLCPTPLGMIAWTHDSTSSPTAMGLYRFEQGRTWTKLPTSGDALPVTVTDGSSIVYDSRRKQLIMTTTAGKPEENPSGQVWTYDVASGVVTKRDPAGLAAVRVARFAREAVYLPGHDLVMMGYLFGAADAIPFYDPAGNRWLTAEIAGSEFMGRTRDATSGASVDLGLVHDAKRDLVWGVTCKLTQKGALNALRISRDSLKMKPLP